MTGVIDKRRSTLAVHYLNPPELLQSPARSQAVGIEVSAIAVLP